MVKVNGKRKVKVKGEVERLKVQEKGEGER